MGSLDQSYLKSLQGNQEADLLSWASKQPETFDTPAEQAKLNPPKKEKSTIRSRMGRAPEETIGDPESTWVEKGLAGAFSSLGTDTERLAGAIKRKNPFEIAYETGNYAIGALPNAVANGLLAVGVPKGFVDAASQALISIGATTPIHANPNSLRGLAFDKFPRAAEVAERATPGAPPLSPRLEAIKAEFGKAAETPAAAAPGTTPAAPLPIPTETVDMVARVISDNKKPTAAQLQQAAEIVRKNPEAPIEDHIKTALGLGSKKPVEPAAGRFSIRDDAQEPTVIRPSTVATEAQNRLTPEQSLREIRLADQGAWAAQEDPNTGMRKAIGPDGPTPWRTTWGEVLNDVRKSGASSAAPESTIAGEKPQPTIATVAAEKLSDWQQSMLDKANEPVKAAEPRVAGEDYPPGYKFAPTGQEAIYQGIAEQIGTEQKRGVITAETRELMADKLIQDKTATAKKLMEWKPGDPVNAETADAYRKIARTAVSLSDTIQSWADKGQYDRTEAIRARLTAATMVENSAAMYSEFGRGLESAKHFPEATSPMRLADVMPVPLMGGSGEPLVGEALVDALTHKVIMDAGGPDMAFREMQGLESKAQRSKLGSLWERTKQAAVEYFMTTIFSPLTSLKVLGSGELEAMGNIALRGVQEGTKRLVNAVAPSLVDMTKGTMAGDTWHSVQGFYEGNAFMWRSVNKLLEARSRIAKKDGGLAAEKQFRQMTADAFPDYGEATKKWDYQPKISSEKLPEIGERLGERFARGVDIVAAVSRSATLDPLGAFHGMAYEVNWYQAAYSKAGQMATQEGLTGEGWYSRVHDLIENHAPDVDAAGHAAAKDSTYMDKLGGDVGKMANVGGNAAARLFVFPVLKFPLNSFQKGMSRVPVLQNFSMKFNADLLGKNGAEAASLARTKLALGYAVAAPIFMATWNGNITGARPHGILGSIWDAQGKKEYSFKFGEGDYHTYKWMGALAIELGTMTNMATMWREYDGVHGYEMAMIPFAAAGHAFMDTGLMSGLSRIVEGVTALGTDPNKAIELLSENVKTPFRFPLESTVAIGAKYADNVRRQAHSLSESWLRDLPGWSDSNPPTRNIINGEPLLHEGIFGAGSESLFATMTPHNSPALKEMDRLKGANLHRLPDHLEGPVAPQYLQVQTAKVPGIPLQPWQRDRLTVIMTQELKPGGKTLENKLDDLVTSQAYRTQMSDPERISEIQGIWNLYRNAAEERLVSEDPDLTALVKGVKQQKATAKGTPAPLEIQ